MQEEVQVRSEKSISIASLDTSGETVLQYRLKEPWVAAPGERFEVAVNQVTYSNQFPTIREGRDTLLLRLSYQGDETQTEQVETDGTTWFAYLRIHFPTDTFLSPEGVCEYLNRTMDVLLRRPLTSLPDQTNPEQLTFTQQVFSSQTFYYEDPLTQNGVLFVNTVPNPGLAPRFATFFEVPRFEIQYGRMRIYLLPQHQNALGPPNSATGPSGYFCWNYEYGNWSEGHEGDLANRVLLPPTPWLTTLEVSCNHLSEGFPSNIAYALGFRAGQGPFGERPPSSTLPAWGAYAPSQDLAHLRLPLPSPAAVQTFPFYQEASETAYTPNTVIHQNTLDCQFWTGEDANPLYLPTTYSSAVAYNRYGEYAIVDAFIPQPIDLYPYMLQFGLAQQLTEAQEMLGFQQTPQTVLVSVPLSSTVADDRVAYYCNNRVFYPLRGDTIRDLQVQYLLDGQPYMVKTGMPIFVELHVRRVYDPSSDRARENAPLYADPYLGFRGFQGTDPGTLFLPSGMITHK